MPCRLLGAALLGLTVYAAPTLAEDRIDALLKELQAARKQSPASPQARAGWDHVLEQGPAVLPRLLEAMDTPDTAVANWLRTAFDRIAESALQGGGSGVD